jgi:DNA-binding MarR family transcriptional regulator
VGGTVSSGRTTGPGSSRCAVTRKARSKRSSIRSVRHHAATSIARYSHSDAGAMTRTLGSLEEKGLVAGSRPRDDCRGVQLQSTSRGPDGARTAPPILNEVMEARPGGLSETGRRTLANLSRRVCANTEGPAA